MKEWGFTIEMEKLPKVMEDYLKADIEFFKARLKYEAWKDLRMFVRSKDKLDKIGKNFTLLKGFDLAKIGIETIDGWFNILTMDDMQILRFLVYSTDDKTYLEVYFNEDYFQIWDSLRSGSRVHSIAFSNPMTKKNGMLKQFEKQIRSVYTKNFEIRVHSE